ncbi:Protease 4 [Sebaldella termitidis]|uniref:Signal peptide peptidase SppA, 36K type n=1 Tax=Sebaldella termitidis (strain ATCC 33386 / NCTC 11300) TaxID=526218 RepID=D1AMP2_SEBTE|nr:signal peptide peptidase SppA [Sebaldella termitidis]ACZ09616.1 signal peptide peptidase SppA, 36K type [Sebaldella termitidis ATCC 33386]SUI24946.1 Protease 4 [Sebaldella termitidis]
MKFFDFIKSFFIFTIKEIYSFFLKLLLAIVVFTIVFLIFAASMGKILEQKNTVNKNYEYVVFNPYDPTEDKLNNKLFVNSKYNVNFYKIVNSVDYIAQDPKVKGVIINLDQISLNSSQIEELIPKFEKIKKSGKKIYAYGSYIDNNKYSLAVNASEISMVPSASADLSITGYHYSSLYYKNLFDKLGIDIKVIHIGDFKSYGENYTRTSISDELKGELTRIFDRRLDIFTENISKARKIDKNKLSADVMNGDSSFLTPFNARDRGFIDKLEYSGQLFQRLGITDENIIDIYDYAAKMRVPEKKDKIAVIYAEGPIMYDENTGNNIAITPVSIAEKIKQLKKVNNLKGVVLRINSPGGSALSAELIYQMFSEMPVPVYVSMGSTAASGGYYIAMAGDKIFADKSTITGSVGVVSTIPKIKKAAGNLGIDSSSITKGKYSDLYDPFVDLSEESTERLRTSMQDTYKEFKSRVEKNRGISADKLEEYAQGKVWLGDEAKEIGLVDQIGSLDDTIQAMAKDLKLQNYSVEEIFVKEDYNKVLQRLSGYITAQVTLMDIPKVMNEIEFLKQNSAKPLYYLPYDIKSLVY